MFLIGAAIGVWAGFRLGAKFNTFAAVKDRVVKWAKDMVDKS